MNALPPNECQNAHESQATLPEWRMACLSGSPAELRQQAIILLKELSLIQYVSTWAINNISSNPIATPEWTRDYRHRKHVAEHFSTEITLALSLYDDAKISALVSLIKPQVIQLHKRGKIFLGVEYG